MSNDRPRGNREAKKPKKAKPKTIAAAPTTKGHIVTNGKPGAKN
ncbi:hypothetical protein MPEAHAMD_6511 [Methylobacterium frigidaeris]|uniref:Uncharacterized protein n=1 Tax=Methylobacterium frigidaeris TaxID=2038277 RepID=A0AA37HIA9_9HYPH|nr:hypothetical protein MPEAHAMD_6511 [Methylobacterium frigidaeris]